MRENTVVLSKRGLFFYAYDNDAIVLHNVTNYKLVEKDNGKLCCGFPESALAKVVIKLKEKEISYKIYRSVGKNPSLMGEQTYMDSDGYKKYSELSDYDKAYNYFSNICEIAKKIKQKTGDLNFMLDLRDEELCNNLFLIKEKLDSL